MSEEQPEKPVLRLVREFSDTNFPYINFCVMEAPFDPKARQMEKEALLDMIEMIDTQDYKIIEHMREFEVRFKHHFDHVHFGQMQEKPLDHPVQVDFYLPEPKGKYISNVSKLKNYFKRAKNESGLTDQQLRVRMDPETKCVSVTARSLAGYVIFWQHVPESGRRRLITHDL